MLKLSGDSMYLVASETKIIPLSLEDPPAQEETNKPLEEKITEFIHQSTVYGFLDYLVKKLITTYLVLVNFRSL